MLEYPALLQNRSLIIINNKPLTQRWRFKVRKQLQQRYTLDELLFNNPENKQIVLKDICNDKLTPYIKKLKEQRNYRRSLLTLWGLRHDYPADPIAHILTFTKY